jgi:hypothetical protein
MKYMGIMRAYDELLVRVRRAVSLSQNWQFTDTSLIIANQLPV